MTEELFSNIPQQLIQSPLDNLAAVLREKENKINALNSEYKDLQREFETNYEIVTKRDQLIAKLNGNINVLLTEIEATKSRSRLTLQYLNQTSEKVTSLEKRDQEIQEKMHATKGHLLKVQFEIAKLKETQSNHQFRIHSPKAR